MKKIIISALLLLMSFSTFAHNLWIETSSNGSKGKLHTANVYLGGYGENERDSTSKWFGNTKSLILWLTAPDGTKKQLTTKEAVNSMEAQFTPDQEGIYTLSLVVELTEVYRKTKYKYHATSQVKVGAGISGQKNLVAAVDLSSSLLSAPTGVGKDAVLKVQYKGTALEKTWCSVGSPAGWVKGFETNKNGEFSFQPVWPGVYVIEVFYEEETPGTVGEQVYEKVSHISTYSLTIGR